MAPASPRAAGEAERSLDAVAEGARGRLGPVLGEVFTAGDSLQRDAVDLTWSSAPTDPFDPGSWLAGGFELAQTAGLTATRFFLPGDDACLAGNWPTRWRSTGWSSR